MDSCAAGPVYTMQFMRFAAAPAMFRATKSYCSGYYYGDCSCSMEGQPCNDSVVSTSRDFTEAF